VSTAEEALREIRRARDSAVELQTGAEVRLAEARTRLEALEERLREEHGATLHEAGERLDRMTTEGTFDAEEARAELPRLRDAERSLGAVNALALEEFEEEKARLESLRTQRDDLREAEATLRDTINEINRTAAERFGETFEQVREAFQGLFRDLFGETAQADLALEGDDPLEAPVEIFAQPRGKRPSAISQLSGGEKALTAIALLFAIYLVKPSPFCILDEVDAPLDDTNVERFMRLIRQFEHRTQFILVTHNKLTMEAADRLYGITMPEPGVSRLVGVRFDGEAEAVDMEVAQPA
jgi:chromosome segregation protein